MDSSIHRIVSIKIDEPYKLPEVGTWVRHMYVTSLDNFNNEVKEEVTLFSDDEDNLIMDVEE